MAKHNEREQPAAGEGSGIKGGKEALRPEEQVAPGIEPDSVVDAALRREKQRQPGGLEPNTIVRN